MTDKETENPFSKFNQEPRAILRDYAELLTADLKDMHTKELVQAKASIERFLKHVDTELERRKAR